MTELSTHEQAADSVSESTPPLNPLNYLSPDSYTTRRLQHATPEHLHLTTRRCFIGPIPEGWLRSHRRDWYRHHLGLHYSSKQTSFTAALGTGKQRRLTGLDHDDGSKGKGKSKGQKKSGKPGLSFPQPEDIAEEHIEDEAVEDEVGNGDEATTQNPKGVEVPRATTGSGAMPVGGSSNYEIPKDLRDGAPDGQHSEGGVYPLESSSDVQPPDATTKIKDPTAASQPITATAHADNALSPSQTHDNKPLSRLKSGGGMSPSGSRRSSATKQSGATSGQRTWTSATSKLDREESGSSFVTARESPVDKSMGTGVDSEENHRIIMDGTSEGTDTLGNRASTIGTASRADSTTALLNNPEAGRRKDSTAGERRASSPSPRIIQKSARFEENAPLVSAMAQGPVASGSGLVRFNLPEDDASKDDLLKMRLAQHRRRDTFNRIRKGKAPQGEIVKMEKMLVRVEYTQHELTPDFDENESQAIESRTMDKWREFMVVCRESTEDDADYVLQMYKSRVIPATEKTHVRKGFAHEISLTPKRTNVNIFSSLDKTIVAWEPHRRGALIYIMRPRSGASAMEWFTFLRSLLGWERSALLQVNIPDLAVSLRIDHPFENIEGSENLKKAAEGDQEALKKTVQEERAVAGNLVMKCIEMLEKSPEWGNVIEEWALAQGAGTRNDSSGEQVQRVATAHHAEENGRPTTGISNASSKRSTVSQLNGHRPVGLAWKRYDRLEWVHGANEKSMYGTIGMEKSHELELRPKQHYPTVVTKKGGESLTEPPPVEGFLVRLTTQKGQQQKIGKLFFKRLYFATHSQFILFSRPAQADPPPPPTMPMLQKSGQVPNAQQIAAEVPLIYGLNPYPLKDDQIDWLDDQQPLSAEDVVRHDKDAFDENERKINNLLRADGLINMVNIRGIRHVQRGAAQADADIDEGSNVEFHQDVPDTEHEDGSTLDMDDERTFELVLKNGLIVRLQAFDKETKLEWMRRLRALVEYWTLRNAADMALFKSVRRSNLEALKIDEEQEAVVGQFAHKWEVNQSHASPELYHMCGISCCRTVMMAGTLFRKPRMHATFSRCHVVLSHGHLLVFQDAVRSRSGSLLKHIHHEKIAAIDLSECYIYSGLVTSNDMLTTGTDAYDKTKPGHQGGLPRMYVEDGWSSTDEDTMTCFVIWHGQRKGWFRSDSASKEKDDTKSKLRRVTQLGKEGRSVVFKTRSRAERDHWVMSIGMEIERLAQSEDVRIVEKK